MTWVRVLRHGWRFGSMLPRLHSSCYLSTCLPPNCSPVISRTLASDAQQHAMKYTEHHEWIRMEGAVGTVGITTKAADSLGELVYVEIADPETEVAQGDECGSVESVKAVSEIYAPVSGRIVEKNPSLSETPNLVNKEPHGDKGWLFRIELTNPSELDDLMTGQQYESFIKDD